MTTQITRTEDADTITYTAIIDSTEASTLTIDAVTRMVWNVETLSDYCRQGLARQLWEAANAEAECFHALDHHRTAEGQAFAEAVGGETIDDEHGHVAGCGICDGDFIDDDEQEW